jgi:hypothetical protein
MAVRRRDFPGLYQLKAEEHRVRGQLSIVEPGLTSGYSAVRQCRADADDIARPLQES